MRTRKVHELKTSPESFKALVEHRQLFQFRRADRDFQIGDVLVLKEHTEVGYTGHEVTIEITHLVATGQGLAKGYVGLGLAGTWWGR